MSDDRVRSTDRLWAPLDGSLNWSCGFGEHPTDPPCMDPAKWHGFTIHGFSIIAAMSSCDEHLAAMKLSAHYVHEMDSACMLPGSWFCWPKNACTLPGEPVAAEAGAAVADVVGRVG